MHFVVNKQTAPDAKGQKVIHYQFEEDLFVFVSQLIEYYLDQRKPITEASGAVLLNPIIRTVSIDYYDPRPSMPTYHVSPGLSPWGSPKVSPQVSPQLPRKQVGEQQHGTCPRKRTGSQPLLSLDEGENEDRKTAHMNRSGSVPSIDTNLKVCGHSKTEPGISVCKLSRTSHHQRTGSEPVLMGRPGAKPDPGSKPQTSLSGSQKSLTGSEGSLDQPPPPKPSRVPTIKKKPDGKPVVKVRNVDLYDDDDRDYSDYDQVKSWPSDMKRSSEEKELKAGGSTTKDGSPQGDKTAGQNDEKNHQDILRKPRKSATESDYDVPKSKDSIYDKPRKAQAIPVKDAKKSAFILPDMKSPSHFSLATYDSEILTPNNKPLEGSAVTTIKSLILETQPKVMAQHMTWLDLELLKITGGHDLGLGVFSGLELITLPQGRQMRLDLCER